MMTTGPTDPRLNLSVDDLLALNAALTIAPQAIPDADRRRFEALATKLAAVAIQTQQNVDMPIAAHAESRTEASE